MLKRKTIFIIFCIILLSFLFSSFNIYANSMPYKNYNFNFWQEAVPAPQAYLPETFIDGNKLGISDFNNPEDVFVRNEKIYILDSGNNRIVVIDSEYKLLEVIDEIVNINNQIDNLRGPRGLFVTEEEHIFIADTGNRRVVELDKDKTLIREITIDIQQEAETIRENLIFRPIEVGVDPSERIFVVVDDAYDGLFHFGRNGQFNGFIGAPRVSPDFTDHLWRILATEDQRRRRALFLPINYNNLDVSDIGFIYATVGGEASAQVLTGGFISTLLGLETENVDSIRKLNPSGEDILRRNDVIPPVGDNIYLEGDRDHYGIERTEFIDVTARENNIYSVLSNNGGRIFTYNQNGDLLYVFGSIGNMKGAFQNPVAIESFGEKLLVADNDLDQINIYVPTKYATNIHQAIDYYENGIYESAYSKWQQLISQNINFELGYIGIGRTHYGQRNYEEAIKYFRMGQDRQSYSAAFLFYRNEKMTENFGRLLFVLLAFTFLYILMRVFKIKKKIMGMIGNDKPASNKLEIVSLSRSKLFRFHIKRILKSLFFSFHLIIHPFGGFWDLKRESKGNFISASIILIITILVYVFMRLETGFVFNTLNFAEFNLLSSITSILIPFILWCVVNWAVTTLMDGKGTLKDIYIATSYALTPLIIIVFPLTIISNYLTLEEAPFYFFLLSISIIWTFILILFGNIVTHDYTFSRGVLGAVVTIIGIGTTLFLFLLFFIVLRILYEFIFQVYFEFYLR